MSKYFIYKILFFIFSLLAMFLVYTLLSYVFYKGISSISLDLIFEDTKVLDAILLKERVFDGIFPAIIGTLMLIFLALSFSLFVGLICGVYISLYANKNVKSILNFSFEFLASIPSILIGLFFLLLSIYLHKKFESFTPSLFLSSLALSLLIMPYIVKNTQESLSSIPKEIKQLALHLGLSQKDNLFKILLPYCSKDLLSGVFLALGRACEDTAVIMLTGAVASAGIVGSVFSKYEALPFYIYYMSTNYSDQRELNQAFAAALILLFLAIILFIITKLIQKNLGKKYA